MSLYAAFNGKLHADDETGASSCSPSTHESYDFTIMTIHHTLWCFLADEILADCSINRHNKFPAKRFGPTVYTYDIALYYKSVEVALLQQSHLV